MEKARTARAFYQSYPEAQLLPLRLAANNQIRGANGKTGLATGAGAAGGGASAARGLLPGLAAGLTFQPPQPGLEGFGGGRGLGGTIPLGLLKLTNQLVSGAFGEQRRHCAQASLANACLKNNAYI